MSSSGASSLADRLVTACANGDIRSGKEAILNGASVNEEGWLPWGVSVLPLAAAVQLDFELDHHHVIVWLLSLGADPNGDDVMYYGTIRSTAAILQLLIDAGGDVNRSSHGQPPLFWAVGENREDKVRVLLACFWPSPPLILPSTWAMAEHQSSMHVMREGLHWRL